MILHKINWRGIYDELTKISNTTLVITGADDNNNVPSANSLIIAGKISRLAIQIKDAGHALFVQYPDKVNKVLQTFISTTTQPS
ncbi:MAG TPA: alpha/beta hydrolase [Nitrososphaeraceae archaeon]|jgi:pimeloyl-ACP methyl ester carboxylesterase|nr:alpha/beta hydrolase [Nitrososphaeraceae archaeon]